VSRNAERPPKKIRVLVVEDDASLLFGLRKNLEY